MSKFVIISDSSCDLTADLRERFGLDDYLKGVIYFPNGHSELLSLDWETMTPDEYYSSMKGRNALYKTASAPMGDITEVFERHLSAGEDILSISISSGLSAMYNESALVAKDLLEKYPDRKILCVDSLRYSTSEALLVILACMYKEQGHTLEETYEYVETTKHTIHQMGTMDDLFFLVKTGRLSNFKAFFGSLVGVNAMADINDKGLSQVIAKTKGKRTAFELILNYIDKTIINPEEQIIFVAHSQRERYAKMLAEQIKERFSPKEIIINDVGMGCGANIGPGLCAAFYQGTKISENLADETKIMNDALEQMKNNK